MVGMFADRSRDVAECLRLRSSRSIRVLGGLVLRCGECVGRRRDMTTFLGLGSNRSIDVLGHCGACILLCDG